eukprot:3293152-Prymnesium_polylepis.2
MVGRCTARAFKPWAHAASSTAGPVCTTVKTTGSARGVVVAVRRLGTVCNVKLESRLTTLASRLSPHTSS